MNHITDFDRVKLFLLSDMIDDIILNKQHSDNTEAALFMMISSATKQLTKTFGRNSLEEFDTFKNQIDLYIDSVMESTIS